MKIFFRSILSIALLLSLSGCWFEKPPAASDRYSTASSIEAERTMDVPSEPKGSADRAAWREKLGWGEECESSFEKNSLPEEAGLTLYEVTPGVFLVEVLCSTGAYQSEIGFGYYDSTAPSREGKMFSLDVLLGPEGKEVRTSVASIFGLSFYDAEKRELSVLSKYSGYGDCGTRGIYKLSEGELILDSFASQPDCQREVNEDETMGDWPIIYTRSEQSSAS